MAFFLTRTIFSTRGKQWAVLLIGSLPALLLFILAKFLQIELDEEMMMYFLGVLYLVLAGYYFFSRRDRRAGKLLTGMGIYLIMANVIWYIAQPIADLSRQIDNSFWSDAIFQLSDYIQVFFQIPQTILMIPYLFAGVIFVEKVIGSSRLILATIFLALGGALAFTGNPLAMVGTAFIIIFAFAVRSMPASVRSGVASLQQIDPAIEEASNSLGADAQHTFRKVTLPLITPALLAGLIFAFTRHMTSLSAIIFLVSPRWRIVTASILSEWEQGGVSVAAAYATVIILLVLVAIGIMYLIITRMMKGRDDVDLTLGA